MWKCHNYISSYTSSMNMSQLHISLLKLVLWACHNYIFSYTRSMVVSQLHTSSVNMSQQHFFLVVWICFNYIFYYNCGCFTTTSLLILSLVKTTYFLISVIKRTASLRIPLLCQIIWKLVIIAIIHSFNDICCSCFSTTFIQIDKLFSDSK